MPETREAPGAPASAGTPSSAGRRRGDTRAEEGARPGGAPALRGARRRFGARLDGAGAGPSRGAPAGDGTGRAGGTPLPRSDPIAEPDWRRLAALHRRCLPDSAITALGARYAGRFYRYLAGSAREHAFLHRDPAGIIDAACIVSLEPGTLRRRLWRATPLLRSLLGSAPLRGKRVLARALWPSRRAERYEDRSGAGRRIRAPEIILLFVAPERRRQGLGRALLARARAWLGAAGHRRCLARTLDARRNRAADFYRAAGFRWQGRSRERGFQVWEHRG